MTSTTPRGIVQATEQTEIELLPEYQAPSEGEGPVGITYDDIDGLGDTDDQVREMIELPLEHPELFARLGIDPPKGVLLYGPPGTGKTLLARAVANETNAHTSVINGPEILGRYYGESEERLRSVFEEAAQNAPAILFIDDLDSIAPARDETGETERRVVAQLLTPLDGLVARGNVVVIGATNRPTLLDPALLRPGRFDEIVYVPVPDQEGHRTILGIQTSSMPLADDVDLDALAERTERFSGADLENLVRKAGLLALRSNLDTETVTAADFDAALGDVRPSVTPEVEKKYERMRKRLKPEDPRGTRPIGFQIAPADGT